MTSEKYNKLSTDELLSLFNKNFFEMHGYRMVFLPKPLTRDWLIDQLFALEWYHKYEHDVKKKPVEEAPVKRTKHNPFK